MLTACSPSASSLEHTFEERYKTNPITPKLLLELLVSTTIGVKAYGN